MDECEGTLLVPATDHAMEADGGSVTNRMGNAVCCVLLGFVDSIHVVHE